MRVGEALRQHFESYRAEAKIMGVIEQVSRYDDCGTWPTPTSTR